MNVKCLMRFDCCLEKNIKIVLFCRDKINFITARKSTGSEILRVYYDENQYIYNDFTDFGYSYEIHPAYRWALQPSSPAALFRQIELLESDDQP